jgi:HNH endonuclease
MSADHPTTPIEYRELAEFPGYRFGADGSVWSRWRVVNRLGGPGGLSAVMTTEWRRLRTNRTAKGYRDVQLKPISGRVVHRWVHRLILEAFVGPCPSGMEACHFNGERDDNRIANLRWDTLAGNGLDKIRHGNHAGEKHYRAKLTWEDVREIRRLRGAGMGYEEIAARYPVALVTIRLICNGHRWKDDPIEKYS